MAELVSVIMPAYNAEKFVGDAILSIVEQSYANWELLICNDSSSDGTEQEIEKFHDARIRYFRNEKNTGYLKTWNFLAEKAAGDYFISMDADDISAKERIEKLISAIKKNNVSLCGSAISLIDVSGKKYGYKKYPTDKQIIAERLYTESFPFSGSAVMFTKEVYNAVGGFRTFYDRLGWEDHDWTIRACEKFASANIPEELYFVRNNAASITRNIHPLEYRKLIVRKVGLAIALHRKETGIDLIDTRQTEILDQLWKQYETPFKKDRSLIFRILSQRIKETNYGLALRYAARAIWMSPLNPRTYLNLYRTLI